MTKLSSALPKGEANGLEAINAALCDHPEAGFIVVAVVDCKSVTTDFDTGDTVATARIRRIEAVAQDDKGRAVEMLLMSTEKRTGKATLPIKTTDDLADLLGQFDPETGEMLDGDDNE